MRRKFECMDIKEVESNIFACQPSTTLLKLLEEKLIHIVLEK